MPLAYKNLKPFPIVISGVLVMFNPNDSLRRALSICTAILMPVLYLSCTAPIKEDAKLLNGRIYAENSTMKKRIPLIERENDVLKKENLQHRMKILDLESQIKQLGLELDSLNDKYDKDMAVGAEQINKLQENIQKIEQESSVKIQGLMSKNEVLKAKMAREIQGLKEQMEKQNDAHIQERKQIMQENAQREFDLTSKLDALQKSLEARELEIASRKMAMDEISSKLGEATAQSDALKKDRQEAAAELESAKAANADLTKNIESLTQKIESLTKNLATQKSGSSEAKKHEPSETKK
jgi:chromosome segregation ATPase